jgi:hypothetical protein
MNTTFKRFLKTKIRLKHVIRSQTNYFEKGLQVFFPRNNFYMQMNFQMKCFVTCSKKY